MRPILEVLKAKNVNLMILEKHLHHSSVKMSVLFEL